MSTHSPTLPITCQNAQELVVNYSYRSVLLARQGFHFPEYSRRARPPAPANLSKTRKNMCAKSHHQNASRYRMSPQEWRLFYLPRLSERTRDRNVDSGPHSPPEHASCSPLSACPLPTNSTTLHTSIFPREERRLAGAADERAG